jgi:predicted TIM-barrel fold metal-dependent hydrolase
MWTSTAGLRPVRPWTSCAGISFTTFSDPSTLPLRGMVGVDHIMFETDYPHTDSNWPETQEILADQLGGLPRKEADQITFGNAARLYRVPGLPA